MVVVAEVEVVVAVTIRVERVVSLDTLGGLTKKRVYVNNLALWSSLLCQHSLKLCGK